MDIKKYQVTGGHKIDLESFDTKYTGNLTPESAKEAIEKNVEQISELQSRLYAEGKTGMLIIFQAMDAAGKDSAIKHVMSGINPQGVDVHSFKQPSSKELAHDYLWRAGKALPERGKIAIFNRSYYEDVLIVKVHKLYEKLNVPERCKCENTIEKRYKQIKNFEEYLWENGIVTVKFFLHLSKETQRKRFLKRIEEKDKNWKFSASDLEERKFWDDYQNAYAAAIGATATKHNPWYIVPADKKWFTRVVISEVLLETMKDIDPQYPKVTQAQESALEKSKVILMNER